MLVALQVMIHSGVQMYLFSVLAIFLPISFVYPDLKIMGRLEPIWVPRSDGVKILVVLNYALANPAVWFMAGWHCVISYVLHR